MLVSGTDVVLDDDILVIDVDEVDVVVSGIEVVLDDDILVIDVDGCEVDEVVEVNKLVFDVRFSVSFVSPSVATVILLPVSSENTKSERQSIVTSPPNTTRVPVPAGMILKVNENARIVTSPTVTVKPASAAAPPDTLSTQPF